MNVAKMTARLATGLLLHLALTSAPARAEGENPPAAPVPAPLTAGIELELPAQPDAGSDAPAPAPVEVPAPAVAPAPAPPSATPSPSAPPATEPVTTAVAPSFPGAALMNPAATFAASIKADHADGVYRLGEKLRAEFVTEQPAYLYVLYHQADGVTKLLFPNRVHTAANVGEGATVQLPAEGEAFRFRIGLPLGKETLQVLAAVQPIAELDQLERPADRAPIVTAAIIEALAGRLKSDPKLWTEHHTQIETVPGVGAN